MKRLATFFVIICSVAALYAQLNNMAGVVAGKIVDAANPTASGDVWGADFEGMDAWFSRVGYRGAFRPNENGVVVAGGKLIPK